MKSHVTDVKNSRHHIPGWQPADVHEGVGCGVTELERNLGPLTASAVLVDGSVDVKGDIFRRSALLQTAPLTVTPSGYEKTVTITNGFY